MRYGTLSRKYGALFLTLGVLLVAISTLLPLWEGQHGEIGSSVSTGRRGTQAAFVAPSIILFGLALVLGGDRMMALVEENKTYGRLFWCAFAAVAIVLGGAHVWWFKHEMAALGYRDARHGHMTRQSSSFALAPAPLPLMRDIATGRSSNTEKSAADQKKDMWEMMSPEMRKHFPDLAPTAGR